MFIVVRFLVHPFWYNAIANQRRYYMNGFDKAIGYDAIKLEIARLCDVIKNSNKY